MRELLRTELKTAMRARDSVAVRALRSAIAAIDNAQAVPADTALPGKTTTGSAESDVIAGSVVGVGNTDVARRDMSAADVRATVAAEVTEWEDSAATYDQLGEAEAAAGLRAEATVLRSVLGAEM